MSKAAEGVNPVQIESNGCVWGVRRQRTDLLKSARDGPNHVDLVSIVVISQLLGGFWVGAGQGDNRKSQNCGLRF